MRTTQDVLDSIRGVWSGHALLTAQELGVLALLASGDLGAAGIADRLSLDLRGTRALMQTLEDLGIVETKGDAYALTPIGSEAADPDGSLSGYLGFHSCLRKSWANLPDRLLGATQRDVEPNRSDSREVVMLYIKAMEALGRSVSADFAAALDVKPGEKVLDLGGGSSVHARAIAVQQPRSEVTLVDRPVVIRLLQGRALPNTRLPRNLHTVAGDYLTFDGDGRFDLAVLANVVHNEGPEENARIMRNCLRALKPGGRLALLDYLPDVTAEFTGPTGFGLLIYLITRKGTLYTKTDILTKLSEAGFVDPNESALGHYSLVIARKAAAYANTV
jgi:ubiquinone/menaquinone biosynthesis C-methylase UbiE